ncbi:MAG: hypothetical protein ABSB73_06170 [Solirubrobacteraceae bacterium]
MLGADAEDRADLLGEVLEPLLGLEEADVLDAVPQARKHRRRVLQLPDLDELGPWPVVQPKRQTTPPADRRPCPLAQLEEAGQRRPERGVRAARPGAERVARAQASAGRVREGKLEHLVAHAARRSYADHPRRS